jgi:RluA family pseudouridine synthase
MPELTTLSSRIHAAQAGTTLIDFLCGRFRYHDRSAWEAIIREGSVSVNGAPSTPDYLLRKGDTVSYTVELREPPVDRNIIILHEEESFLAACKPGNLPSHADGNFIKNTFIYILSERMKAAGHTGPVKLVHRLDRETSGIIMVAKTDEAHHVLTRQFERRSVDKEYLAVARGRVAEDSFEVGGAIARDPESGISIRQKVVPEGTPGARAASTRFEVIERLSDATLVRCLPATGRTNQIRVHMAHAGHPLVGDKLYGRTDDEFLEFVRNARAGNFDILPWMDAPRHLLHASRLTLDHPQTGERITFESEMPGDMAVFIECMR